MALWLMLMVVAGLLASSVKCLTEKDAVLEYLADQLVRTGNLLNELPSLQNNHCSLSPVPTNGGPIGDITPVDWPCNITKKDCLDHYLNGCSTDGVYLIDPGQTGRAFRAYCDMTMNGGGWTVIQRRIDDTVNFFRDWGEYENGFGFLTGNMWVGLDSIHKLTTQPSAEMTELYIHLENFADEQKYTKFFINDYKDFYKLHVAGYSGTAGDSFTAYSGAQFSTYDVDVDTYVTSCALKFRGGWWYTQCHGANLNGLYLGGNHTSYANGVNYQAWMGYHYSLKTTVMKVRRQSNEITPL